MPNRRHLTIEESNQALGMLRSGHTQRSVARQFNVSHSVSGLLWERYLDYGSVAERHRSGRPRKTTDVDDRFIVVTAKRDRFQSAKAVNGQFLAASGIRISDQTVRNRLHTANLDARRPLVRPPLTVRHRRERLQFAHQYKTIGLPALRPILFTDESKFCVDFHDGRRRVWRQTNERYSDVCVAEHDRFGGGSVLVWGGISYDGATDLYTINNGSLTSVRYRDEILDGIVRPFAGAVGPGFILMDDNARPHRAFLSETV